MFKKFTLMAVVAAALSLPAFGQTFQNYISNGGFGSGTTGWTLGNNAYLDTTSDDPCDYYFGYSIKAVALFTPGDTVSQTFTVGTGWTSFAASFEVQAQSISGGTVYDEIRMVIHDNTTNQTEVGFINGAHLTSTCQRVDVPLSNNYNGHSVTVTLNSQPFTLLHLYVDNISFFGRSY
ncbi:MAG TPA: hypothetical protein VJ276_23385 [Thermoanaerobaculia bacterium]|nr:hypothetical protein [Thermoanaerobaculia bacterium]